MDLYLLSIGIDEYLDEEVPNLCFAVNDARSVYQAFSVAVAKNSFHGKLLIGEQATLSQVKSSAGEWIARNASKEDSVVIYFAGHGAIEVEPGSDYRSATSNYLVPYDAVADSLY